MDDAQLRKVIDSIWSLIPDQQITQASKATENDEVQFLLPVDLLVSVNRKTNAKTIKAAIPSSFAIYPQPVIIAPSKSNNNSNNTKPTLSASQICSQYPMYNAQQQQTLSQQASAPLNPSAASFDPSSVSQTFVNSMEPIAEYPDEGSSSPECTADLWYELDAPSTSTTIRSPSPHPNAPSNAAISPKFKATKQVLPESRDFSTNWRNNCGKSDTYLVGGYKVSEFEQKEFKGPRLLAEFVEHVTLQNRQELET